VSHSSPSLSWFGILRFGLVQAALGSIVVLATSVMNRVMVVELALPAVLPAALVGFHYAIQLVRPRLGHGSDRGRRPTRWIIGGVALLAAGAIGAAFAISLMTRSTVEGLSLVVVSFAMIGIGVGAAGTSLLASLAKRCAPQRRPVAATVVWLMMIAGFVLTTVVAGRALEPFSPGRLIEVTSVVASVALFVSVAAMWRIEDGVEPRAVPPVAAVAVTAPPFRAVFAEVWQEPKARALTIFIFLSMLAYSSEELILDPFAGKVFGFTPGQSTQLSAALHGGVFLGMLAVAVVASVPRLARVIPMHRFMLAGCLMSALALLMLAGTGMWPSPHVLKQTVMALGIANGVFAVSAIASMMTLAGVGGASREGVRIGLWGAAQGVAFGCGGLFAAASSDLARALIGAAGPAYALVFMLEAVLFVVAAMVSARIYQGADDRRLSGFKNLPQWSPM